MLTKRKLDGWALEIGSCATHTDQRLPALVEWRNVTGNGDEIYGLRIYRRGYATQSILMIGAKLRPSVPRSEDCIGCELLNTELCPGLHSKK